MTQKKLPLINSAHGSETRNIINELIKLFNDMGYTYNESLQKAQDILAEAQQTNDTNENVQQQIDTLIAESGTSDAEVLQARVDAEGNEYQVLKERLDEKEQNFSTQMAHTEEKNPNNAPIPLSIKTYDGFNRTTHPDVIYFENGWNRYNYWMVHTPFPFDNDFWENPSIVVSNDGVAWQDVPGIKNPIDEVTEEENEAGIYLSDGMLIFVNNRLECFYRWFNKNTREERFYRQYSHDGVTWEGKEIVLDNSGSAIGLGMVLSPTMVYENERYRMWVVDNPNRRIMYSESTDGKGWGTFEEVSLHFEGRTTEPWHIHVYKESENLYHLTFSEYTSTGGRSIFWGTSTDGKSFSNIKEILKTRRDEATWDSGYLYKPSLLKVGNLYKLYYSARSAGGQGNWRIGLIEGKNLETLRTMTNYDADFYNQIPRIRSEYIRTDSARVDGTLWMETTEAEEERPGFKLLKRGSAGVGVEVGQQNTLRIINDREDGLGDLETRKITLDGVEIFVGSGGDSVHISTSDGYRDLVARAVKTTRLESMNDSNPIMVRNEKGMKFLIAGKYGASLRTTATDTLTVMRDNENGKGHLEAGSIILDGASRGNIEGSIRYNSNIKKHQGYDGTTWHDLY